MGKNWFCCVNKSFSSEPKEKKDQKSNNKPKKRWFGKRKSKESVRLQEETTSLVPPRPPAPSPPPPPIPTTAPQPQVPPPSPAPPLSAIPSTSARLSNENLNSKEDEEEQNRKALALATAVAAEAAVVAAQAAAEVVRLTAAASTTGKSREEVAAIKIQTAYRGYMARRALRVARGLSRLKALIQGDYVKRQANGMLRSMRAMTSVRSQIRERRTRLSEENKARHRLLYQTQHQKVPDKTKTPSIAEDFDCSTKTKEQIKSSLLYRKEAATRRERALAYAYSHQRTWRNSSKLPHQRLMDPSNPHWGWSWLERWMAVRPWEPQSKMYNSSNDNQKSVKSSASHETTKPRKTSLRPKPREAVGTWDSTRAGSSSSVKDDESVASPSTVKSHLGPTKTVKSRVSLTTPSHLGSEMANKKDAPEKKPAGSVKKRLSYSGSPPTRRHLSDPVKETVIPKEVKKQEKSSNLVCR